MGWILGFLIGRTCHQTISDPNRSSTWEKLGFWTLHFINTNFPSLSRLRAVLRFLGFWIHLLLAQLSSLRSRESSEEIMGHSNVWNSHPKNYGPGSRTWYLTSISPLAVWFPRKLFVIWFVAVMIVCFFCSIWSCWVNCCSDLVRNSHIVAFRLCLNMMIFLSFQCYRYLLV